MHSNCSKICKQNNYPELLATKKRTPKATKLKIMHKTIKKAFCQSGEYLVYIKRQNKSRFKMRTLKLLQNSLIKKL